MEAPKPAPSNPSPIFSNPPTDELKPMFVKKPCHRPSLVGDESRQPPMPRRMKVHGKWGGLQSHDPGMMVGYILYYSYVMYLYCDNIIEYCGMIIN